MEITGEYCGCEFKPIKEEDFQDVLNHLRSTFYLDEPLHKLVGMSPERANDLDKRINYLLKNKMSFMAIDKLNGKIAGCLIITHAGKDDPVPEFTPTSNSTPVIRSSINQLYNQLPKDIFSLYGIDSYAELFIVSVAQEWRGKGLATEMYRRAISKLEEMNYKILESVFTNPLSRKVGDKLGFKELARLKFLDAKDDKGNPLIPNASDDQFMNITVLQL